MDTTNRLRSDEFDREEYDHGVDEYVSDCNRLPFAGEYRDKTPQDSIARASQKKAASSSSIGQVSIERAKNQKSTRIDRETVVLISIAALLYVFLFGMIVFAIRTPDAFWVEIVEGLLGVANLIWGLGALVAVLVVPLYYGLQAVRDGRDYGMGTTFRWMLLMALLSAPVIWPMTTYSPEHSTTTMVWLALISAGVLIVDAVLLVGEKNIPWTGKVWRGLLIFPYAVFSSSCAILLTQVTLTYLSDPAESLWLKIIIGLVNLVYTIGCLFVSIGITVGLGPEETK